MSAHRGRVESTVSMQRVSYIAVEKNINVLCVLTARNHVLIEVKKIRKGKDTPKIHEKMSSFFRNCKTNKTMRMPYNMYKFRYFKVVYPCYFYLMEIIKM